MRKELDHVLMNSQALAKSHRVYRGAEAQANTDHHLVVTEVPLAFVFAAKQRTPPKYNVQRLVTDEMSALSIQLAAGTAASSRFPS